MIPRYKPIKYNLEKWQVIKKLADLLSAKRGTKVSLSDASVEASKKMTEEIEQMAGTPGGQAQG